MAGEGGRGRESDREAIDNVIHTYTYKKKSEKKK